MTADNQPGKKPKFEGADNSVDTVKPITFAEFKTWLIDSMRAAPGNCDIFQTLLEWNDLYLVRTTEAPPDVVNQISVVMTELQAIHMPKCPLKGHK